MRAAPDRECQLNVFVWFTYRSAIISEENSSSILKSRELSLLLRICSPKAHYSMARVWFLAPSRLGPKEKVLVPDTSKDVIRSWHASINVKNHHRIDFYGPGNSPV